MLRSWSVDVRPDLVMEMTESAVLSEWSCPYCEHFLHYRREHSDVAAMAMMSHLRRRHNVALTPSHLREERQGGKDNAA